jgi:hypothetical protein
MAEAVGLVLSVLGIAGLFSTCIECFDIVVAGKDFSEDYEQLCALVSQKVVDFVHFLIMLSFPCSDCAFVFGGNR